MFITKGVVYIVLIGLGAIAGLILLGIALTKPKAKRMISRKQAFALGIILLGASGYYGLIATVKAYHKIKTTYTNLKNFPELTETSNNNDTTDYVKVLKEYEPEKYKGRVPDGYYTYYGIRDWWRFPVVYPYSLTCIDVLDHGSLSNDSSKTNFEEGNPVVNSSPEFTRFTFDANYLAADIYTAPAEKTSEMQFFILEFKKGKVTKYKDKESMNKQLDVLNFKGEKTMSTIRKYSERF